MRTLVSAIAIAICSAPAFAVDGTNLPGRDYANFPAPSAFVCRTSCGGESACQAYTWVKPGIQGPTGHCWLKNALPAIVKDGCCDSAPREFISKRDLVAEDKINRPGSDSGISSSTTGGRARPRVPRGICASWTYVRAGAQGPRGHCWLRTWSLVPSSMRTPFQA